MYEIIHNYRPNKRVQIKQKICMLFGIIIITGIVNACSVSASVKIIQVFSHRVAVLSSCLVDRKACDWASPVSGRCGHSKPP